MSDDGEEESWTIRRCPFNLFSRWNEMDTSRDKMAHSRVSKYTRQEDAQALLSPTASNRLRPTQDVTAYRGTFELAYRGTRDIGSTQRALPY